MADFCLLPRDVDKLRASFEDGELSAATLGAMTSAERHSAFASLVGEENATRVNASFESKLLLKHQQDALARWVESASKVKPEVKRDMLSKVARLDRVLSQTEERAFLTDLAKQRLGFGVTMEEAGKVTELAQSVQAARDANDWPGYLEARANFREYLGPLQTPPLTKAQGLAAYVRAGALSWPTTLLKLSSVAISRFVTTPTTDAVGAGLAKLFPRLADGAEYYGATPTTAMKAEAAAVTAAWQDGRIDAGRMLMNKASRLDLAHGENATAHRWFEYTGSIHGALKEPVKRAAYARSMFRRLAVAAANGEDVNDLGVKMRVSTEAYQDALGSVSMNDNAITSAWNAGMRSLETPDKATGDVPAFKTMLSTVAHMEVPISKAPTNVILEASDYIGGLLTGGGKAAYAYARGIEDLKPVQRDAIIRQISRGSIGAAIMALYYFKHDQVEFGGFYERGEKRGPNDVPAGAMRVGGVTISKTWLHNPVMYAAQYAATMARTIQHDHTDDPSGIISAAGAATLGLIDEIPVIGGISRDVRDVMDPKTRAEFMSRKVASLSVPGAVQWIAKQTDPAPKRAPKGLTQHLEANLPGLRESVPTTKRKR